MVRAVVAGAAGRMGSRILHMIQENPDVSLAGAFERPGHTAAGRDAGEWAGLGRLGVPIAEAPEEVMSSGDVLIDFTAPEAAPANIRTAASWEKAAVIGTTGLAGGVLEEVLELGKRIPLVLAPNMSVGMNLMFRIAAEMARALGEDYDVEILETHHRFKKDAPSGTALKLARSVAEALGRDADEASVYHRRGMIGERGRGEIGIQALRAGDVTGEHTVMFGGMGERLELTHKAHNRDNFARGALRAACWVVGRPPGVYDMQDVLGLK